MPSANPPQADKFNLTEFLEFFYSLKFLLQFIWTILLNITFDE